ncbi:MAG: hypothetical protein OEL91_08820, partial [Burkholderiaceae bacterium]|nr:hypothetical protein [Burkholderiaceae bacterium]
MTQHSRLVQGLLHGDAFDHPAFARELIETHISSLVLAGEFVYKLRKPLRLDFLDFSTPELRRVDCEEELRLNRRTAAAFYLNVVPVLGPIARPRIGSTDSLTPNSPPPLDWALRMRRFDNALLLDRLARKGALMPQHIDA